LVPELCHYPIKKEGESKPDEERGERRRHVMATREPYMPLSRAPSHLSSFDFATITQNHNMPHNMEVCERIFDMLERQSKETFEH
jgi:hypothetical protein